LQEIVKSGFTLSEKFISASESQKFGTVFRPTEEELTGFLR
jgi:hypothetical protein